MSEEAKTLTLFQKIHAVMKDVEYLKKDDQVKFGQTNYKAISEEKVTVAVRNSLVKNGLIILPVKQEHKKEGNLSTVDVTYRIIDVDSGEHIEVVSSGTGADTQDKGVGKAMTYAYKYMLLRSFAIPTGEDPDKVSSAELDAKQENDKNNLTKPITPELIGTIKVKAGQFAQARNKTVEDVYKALKINDITKLNIKQANAAESRLDGWLSNLSKQQGA
ncbi:ERF family protein [Heyndrickxia sp. FSL W8-0496]|uniref:ERF family protein n=1 Tax=Heyndrickxia sp. FSL W8-0496 TaxID=2954702 RepID=UPI0030F78E92